LQALFKHCQYLIIDEKSMIGIKFLGLLDQRLRETSQLARMRCMPVSTSLSVGISTSFLLLERLAYGHSYAVEADFSAEANLSRS
jgi:hypothetical protein